MCSLESLPDELLLIILSNLHAIDRLRTFNNLNSRFDRCLLELGVGIEDDLVNNEFILKKFASRIIFIRCKNRHEELELDQFPALRSLTLYSDVWPQIAAINPIVMPSIKHISLQTQSIFNVQEGHTELLGDVLCGKFPWLQSIHLSRAVFSFEKDVFDMFIPSFRIRSASINICHASLFEILLAYLPELITLKVRIDEWHLANKLEEVKLMPKNWRHYSLGFLDLQIDSTFKKRHFKWLKRRLPMLMHLDVDSQHDPKHQKRKWIYNSTLMNTIREVAYTSDSDQ